jgi:hypothetical protein
MIGLHNESTLLRQPKVLVDTKVSAPGGRTKTIKAAVPSHQVTQHKHQQAYYTNSFKSVPSNLFRNNGSRYSGEIESKAFTKMKSVTLKITVTVTGDSLSSCQFAPVPYWFDRIEIRTQNGSKHLGILRNDQMMFNLNMIDQDKLPGVLDSANLDSNWNPKWKFHVAGDQVTYYLPLIGSYLGNDQYWSDTQGDYILDFVPSSSIIVEGEGIGNVDCNDLSLIIETENLALSDEQSHQTYHSQVIASNRVLDWVPVTEYGKTLIAGQVFTVDLDSVVGKSAGLVVMVRETGATNLDNKNFTFVDLGDRAQIDLVTAGGKSLYGSGVPLDSQYLKNEVWYTHFASNFAKQKNVTYIPFCTDQKSAFHGVVDGLVEFDNSGHKLQIKLPSAGRSAEQQTKRVGGGTGVSALAGSYRLQFRGEQTKTLLPIDGSGNMEAALRNLKAFKQYEGGPLDVTVSTGLTGGDPRFTFPQGVKVEDPVYIISQGLESTTGDSIVFDTHVEKHQVTPAPVPSVNGFAQSGTYDVTVYALTHVDTHTHKGKTTTSLL